MTSPYAGTWRRYNLRDNPYFISPLTIDGAPIPIDSFVGREKERKQLKQLIQMDSVRCMIVGDAGIGKTSLVNFVRYEAAHNGYFTPEREIEVGRYMHGNEFVLQTISVIYDEVKRRKFVLSKDLMQKLEALYELTRYGDLSVDIANFTNLNRQRLMDLFRQVVDEIMAPNAYPKFKGIVIHYDNLDNITNPEDLIEMIADVRDFLMIGKVVFIFVGDLFLPISVLIKRRVAQIFLTPALEVPPLEYEEISKILKERIERLRSNENAPLISPHTEESLQVLFNLHNGNIREILNSLTNCIISLPSSNIPIQINEDVLKDTLFNKVKDNYLYKLTPVEMEVLSKMLNLEKVTPSELAKLSSKSIQNISSKYIPKLTVLGAVRLKGAEGRNVYYEITPEIKWWKLQRSEQEKVESKEKRKEKIKKIVNTKTLKDFF